MHINNKKVKHTLNLPTLKNPKKYAPVTNNSNEIMKSNNETSKDFFSSFLPTEEEYESLQNEAKSYVEGFNLDLYLDMTSFTKLISIQKHLLELLDYVLFLNQNFEWSYFCKKASLEMIKEKMLSVQYEKFSKKQFLFYLNRFCPDKVFPQFIPLSLGMNYLFKWLKCVVKIYVYLYMNKKLPSKRNLATISETEKTPQKNQTNFTSDFVVLSKRNKYKIVPSSPELQKNEPKDLYITKLAQTISKREKKKSPVTHSSLVLAGFNAMEDKYKREQKVMQFIPFAKCRTFGQLRKYFKMNNNVNAQSVDSKHYYDIKALGFNGENDKSRLMHMIQKNQMGFFDSLPMDRIEELLKE